MFVQFVQFDFFQPKVPKVGISIDFSRNSNSLSSKFNGWVFPSLFQLNFWVSLIKVFSFSLIKLLGVFTMNQSVSLSTDTFAVSLRILLNLISR